LLSFDNGFLNKCPYYTIHLKLLRNTGGALRNYRRPKILQNQSSASSKLQDSDRSIKREINGHYSIIELVRPEVTNGLPLPTVKPLVPSGILGPLQVFLGDASQ
jgi:hypothetical protein